MIEKIELVWLVLFFIKNNPNQIKNSIWVAIGGDGEIRIKEQVFRQFSGGYEVDGVPSTLGRELTMMKS